MTTGLKTREKESEYYYLWERAIEIEIEQEKSFHRMGLRSDEEYEKWQKEMSQRLYHMRYLHLKEMLKCSTKSKLII